MLAIRYITKSILNTKLTTLHESSDLHDLHNKTGMTLCQGYAVKDTKRKI